MDLDLLPPTLLQQKLENYLHHLGQLVPEDVRKEFEAVKLQDIICSSRIIKANLRDHENAIALRKALRDLDYKVDDIMTFILNLSRLRSPMFVFRKVHLNKQLMEMRRHLGEQIQKIQINGGPVPDNACGSNQIQTSGSKIYGVRPPANDVTRGKIMTTNNNDVASWIEEMLLKRGDQRFKVIGVIGMKGIGKTTLVTHVYKNDEVKKYFDCYAWISNPSYLESESILRETLRQFCFGSPPYTLETMDQQTLLSAIDNCLVGKRFLLVLDGVSDSDIWKRVIFPAFPFRRVAPFGLIDFTSSFLHGRIVFTSSFPHRGIFNAYMINQFYVQIRLKALSQEEPGTLFCQLVFTDTKPPGICPPELKEVAEAIIKKSGGLPFVIRLLAAVLRENRNPKFWEKRLSQLWELDQYSDTVKAIFLSYDSLAFPLKSCFLYLSFFPKNIEIPLKRVIGLWVAEGLVEETPERTATETSMAYLQELINRELIQPGHLDVNGDMKSFKFDDHVRSVALDIIDGSFIGKATDNNKSSSSSSSGTAGLANFRLLSIQGNKDIENITSDKNNVARVRSCVVSGMGKFQSSSIMDRCLSGFQFLRMLDLDLKGSEIKTLPNSLGSLVLLVYLRVTGSKLEKIPASALENLILLRYLGLRRTGIRELPAASLLKLKDLHTLDIRETKLRKFPPCISQLLHLRHLYLCSSFRREVMEIPLRKETEPRPLQLQTLAGVRATADLIKELGKWTQLRKLSIGRVAEADSEKFCASIDKMKFLRSLSIRSEINESLHMGFLESSETKLDTIDTLRIGGSVEALHSAITKGCFPSLCRLFLWDNNLTYDPLPMLQGLPNLMLLSLINTFKVKEIGCGTRGFPKLKKLSIFQLRDLESWQINGGMEKLEFLSIGHCKNLKEPPQGLGNLPSLQVVMVAGMDKKFNAKMEGIGKESQYQFKVRPIPLFKYEFGATEQNPEQNPGTEDEEVSEVTGVVLKLFLQDDEAKQKAVEAVSTLSLSGIDSITINMKEQKMIVIGEVDPNDVVGKLSDFHPQIVSTVETEEKDEPKKEEENTTDHIADLTKADQPYHNPYKTNFYVGGPSSSSPSSSSLAREQT